MDLSQFCRICSGYADPKTSVDLFNSRQKELLMKILRYSGISVKLNESLPTSICRSCRIEIRYPLKFLKTYSNSQYFFASNEYQEKLKLMQPAVPQQEHFELINEDSNSCFEETSVRHFASNTTDDELEMKRNCFKCKECNKVVVDRHNYIMHLKRHYGPKNFQCAFCAKQFYTKSELTRHTRIHTGEKPHQCRHCQQCFSDLSTRNKHERVHNDAKPFICEYCGATFRFKASLTNHTITHSGERPYGCVPCNKTFQRLVHLKNHCLTIRHKKQAENENIK